MKIRTYELVLKMLTFSLWLWDVIFTQVDLFQLRIWEALLSKHEELTYTLVKLKEYPNNILEFKSWEDVE